MNGAKAEGSHISPTLDGPAPTLPLSEDTGALLPRDTLHLLNTTNSLPP